MAIASNDTLIKIVGDAESGVAVQNTLVKQINLGASLAVGFRIPAVNKTADHTMAVGDCGIYADASGGAVTITLPSAAVAGTVAVIKRTNSGINAVTIARAGSDTIEGAASLVLASQFASAMLVADGASTWYKIAII